MRFVDVHTLDGDTYVTNVREMIDAGHSALFVADEDGRVTGFVLVGIEAASWKEFRPEAGYVHDLVVDEPRRGSGAGRALVVAGVAWLREQRVELIMLWAAHANPGAQRLFSSLGFHQTMVEMRLDATALDAERR